MDNTLTEREEEVLEYLKQGLTNKEIGEVLHITYHTVKAHVSSILYKLHCKNRTTAALAKEYAIHHQDLVRP